MGMFCLIVGMIEIILLIGLMAFIPLEMGSGSFCQGSYMADQPSQDISRKMFVACRTHTPTAFVLNHFCFPCQFAIECTLTINPALQPVSNTPFPLHNLRGISGVRQALTPRYPGLKMVARMFPTTLFCSGLGLKNWPLPRG